MPSAATSSDPLLGRRLQDRYLIESVIGRGGMATVYLAVDERLKRHVAVKVLGDQYARDEAFVTRFLEEARIAAAFSNPHVVHVYDFGSDGEARFIVLELLEGYRSLHARVREDGPLPVHEAVDVLLQVLSGLEPLHAAGLVHCDVKAGNVLVGPHGAKLIDFGIARPQGQATGGSTSIGSLHAMSPEQLRGAALTPASDIFATGVVLFEALTGRVPFPGETPEQVAAAHRRGPVSTPSQMRPTVPSRLDALVMQSLRLEPRQRFASAAAMAVALRTASSQPASPPTLPQPMAAPRPASGPSGRRVAPALLLAAAIVPALIAALLLANPDQAGEAVQPSATQRPAASPTMAPGMVRVPQTIGLSEAQAEAAARAAGLTWRIEWHRDRGHAPGIYDQEPAAGTVVEAGSRFVMYAYRTR